MSSHREAPSISKDPVADNTDVYAFVSPDNPSTVTIIANYIPLELPAGGPNFFEFGDDVLYEIHIDYTGDGKPDISYQFQFHTRIVNPNIFLYNVGPISFSSTPGANGVSPNGTYANWNRPQTYTVTRVDYYNGTSSSTVLGTNLLVPPCNIGPRSTPNYTTLVAPALQTLSNNAGMVFAGQRADGFYVDLGSVFDLAALRPFQELHLISTPGAAAGVNAVNGFNVHSIALQVPISALLSGPRSNGRGSYNYGYDAATPNISSNYSRGSGTSGVIGVWASASRQTIRVNPVYSIGGGTYNPSTAGPYTQISRLGNPLINEVIIPMGQKDYWNSQPPAADAQFVQFVQTPALASLLPTLYPGAFPHLSAYTQPRADLVAILLTGIPNGVVPGFIGNYTGKTYADQLRLNTNIPPTNAPNIYGLLGGDVAGFPNGRRVFDDVVTIELRAVAGAALPYVDPTFTADTDSGLVSDFVLPDATPASVPVTAPYLSTFPYLGTPFDGYSVPPLPATPNSAP
jgi:hypothetical protein